MIGKPEWFTYRIFGWGVMPRTKEGFAYIFISMIISGIIFALPLPDNTKFWIFLGFVSLIFLDVLHILTQLPKHHDERQNFQQLIIERNVSFAAVSAVIGLMLYEAYFNPGNVEPSLLIILGIMVSAKIISNVYVRWKI